MFLDTFIVTSLLDGYVVTWIGMQEEQYQKTNDKAPLQDIGFSSD
jgi:hypothetical protein